VAFGFTFFKCLLALLTYLSSFEKKLWHLDNKKMCLENGGEIKKKSLKI